MTERQRQKDRHADRDRDSDRERERDIYYKLLDNDSPSFLATNIYYKIQHFGL